MRRFPCSSHVKTDPETIILYYWYVNEMSDVKTTALLGTKKYDSS